MRFSYIDSYSYIAIEYIPSNNSVSHIAIFHAEDDHDLVGGHALYECSHADPCMHAWLWCIMLIFALQLHTYNYPYSCQ